MTATAANSSSRRAWWNTPLSMLAVAFIAFLLYNRALDFGFFNDDPTGHFAWMETRSYGDYFRSSADYGYYRPIVFVILQSLVDSAGHNAQAFHALLLGLHAANVALLWLLIMRLSASDAYAWATALIFAFSPFSYEAVTYVASLTHPLLLFWLLVTLLFYQQARRINDSGWRRVFFYMTAFVTMILGLLTHENGLFIPLAMIGIEWLEKPPTGLVEGLKRPFLPYLLLAPIFLLIWWSIPKTGEQGLVSLPEWLNNLMPFLQTLVYPLLPLFQLTAENTTALFILALLTLGLTFLAAWLARARALWHFGLGWFLFSSLPSILFLSPDYLYGSPRLHYLPAVGVAMLWAMPVLALAQHTPDQTRERFAHMAVGLIYILVIILPPTVFISCEMDFYEETSRLVRRMGNLGEETPPGSTLLFANIPVFFSSYTGHPDGCPNPYPWTPVGAVVVPDYANPRDFVRFNGQANRLVTAVTVQEYTPGWNTFGEPLAPQQLREHLRLNMIYVYDLNEGDFFNLSAVWLPGGAADVEPPVEFDAGLQLNSGTIQRSGENEVVVNLIWQKSGDDRDGSEPVVFVHLYDAAGQLVAQHDSPPGNGFVPVSWWSDQDVVIDTHVIELPQDLGAGQYNVAVGLYNPLNGERYSAVAWDGTAVQDNAFIIGQVTLP
jgi:predicted membrane protein